MKKWHKVLIWIVSIVVVLGIGGLFAANYAVDKVLDSMIGMSVDDLVQEDDKQDTPVESDSTEANEPTDASEPIEQTPGEEQSSNDAVAPEQDNSKDKEASNNGSVKEPATKQEPTTSSDKAKSDSTSGYSATISTEKAKEVEENITIAEKAKVVTTIMGALSSSEIVLLQELASGGLSTEEKKEARDLLLEKLTEEQYNDLIAIAAKHGLSKGKSYSEVKAE